jgi:hypothetical protein
MITLGFVAGAIKRDGSMGFLDYDAHSGGYPYISNTPCIYKSPDECLKRYIDLKAYDLYGSQELNKATAGIYKITAEIVPGPDLDNALAQSVKKKLDGFNELEKDAIRKLVKDGKF